MPVTTSSLFFFFFFFWKLCFISRTSYSELIWCTKHTNVNTCTNVHTFRKQWSFIWGWFFLLSIKQLCRLPKCKPFYSRKIEQPPSQDFLTHILGRKFREEKTGNFKESIYRKCFLKTDYIYSSLNTKTVWLNFLFTSLKS